MEAVYRLNIYEFADLIKTIRYGYMDVNGELHFPEDPDFHMHQYVFSSPEQVLKNKCGWCWDVANLITEYCKAQGLKYHCLFMEYFTEDLHQTHTQVFTEHAGKWYAFPDNSAQEKFGEKGFDLLSDCVADFVGRFEAYLKYVLKDAYNKEKLLLQEVSGSVPSGITDEAYLAFARGMM